jgi:hypothetical protein
VFLQVFHFFSRVGLPIIGEAAVVAHKRDGDAIVSMVNKDLTVVSILGA